MVYPNFEDKHSEEALISPKDFIKARFKNQSIFPKKWIFIFSKHLEKKIQRKFKLKKFKENPLPGNMYFNKNIGFFRFIAFGSPCAADTLEVLIALGGKEFIVVGQAGGLDKFGIYLCDRAIRDEGVSHHYIPASKYVYSNEDLLKRFEKSIKKFRLAYEKGTTWTTDAFFRETKAEIKYYKEDGVKCVDQEASALFAVAQVRKVKIAAAFVVSDLLGIDAWDPQFDRKHVKMKLSKLIDASIDCFSD